MPYILAEARERIDQGAAPRDVGELTYKLTKDVLDYFDEDDHSPQFRDFADAIAALECTKQELYRRAVAPYEDDKAKKNGDIYAPPLDPLLAELAIQRRFTR